VLQKQPRRGLAHYVDTVDKELPMMGGKLAGADQPSRLVARRCFTASLVVLTVSCAACGHSSNVLTAFRSEEQAQSHCPKDTVVWLDPQSGIYYFKGEGPYGSSNAGRYACRGEADSAGMHGLPK
jgi:ribosomal protein L37E